MNYDGLMLFHIAAHLRANELNYISLETALSDAGIISQIPMHWISIKSSGRSNIISCGEFGTIEFVHTNQKPYDIMNQLSYDKLWIIACKCTISTKIYESHAQKLRFNRWGYCK